MQKTNQKLVPILDKIKRRSELEENRNKYKIRKENLV